MLVARLEWAGAQQQPSPARGDSSCFPSLPYRFWVGFFLAGSEPSPPRGLGESPEARAGH